MAKEAYKMTLEQCKKLEKWGMPQTIRKWGLSYLGGNIAFNFADDYEATNEILCPDLEQLLEFVKKKVTKIENEQLWLFTIDNDWSVFCRREIWLDSNSPI